MSHASHKTNQDISDLGIVQGQNKSIPNITLPCPLSLISKADQLIYNPTIINEDVPIGKFIQAYFNFFNATSIWGFTSAYNGIDATSSYLFGFPTRSKRLTVSLIKYIVCVFRSSFYTCDVVYIYEGVDISISDYSMISCHDIHMTVKLTGGYESTINEKVDRPNKIFKNMVQTQLISCSHNDILW